MGAKTWAGSIAAVTATAALGSLATDPGSAWYRALRKPRWQPPPVVFPLVWTPLYALLATGIARAWERSDADGRRRLAVTVAADLGLNVGWTALFFRAHRPRAALVEIGALQAANVDLLRQARAVDPWAPALLGPLVAWTAFATALTAEISRLNR